MGPKRIINDISRDLKLLNKLVIIIKRRLNPYIPSQSAWLLFVRCSYAPKKKSKKMAPWEFLLCQGHFVNQMNLHFTARDELSILVPLQ